MDSFIGQTISHYRILERLGAGGMGVVYKAEDTKLRRTVALKFLPATLLTTDDDRHRFIQEAQATAALSHPNIATVFEVDDSEAQAFIALEYIEGQSLAGKITSGPLKLEEALAITIQMCEGLQAAHEKGIVHRDIKSHNVMLTPRGQVKILDFGLAKLRGASVVTTTGATLGTMGYMSPEQLQGKPVDHRTDLWAVGVVLFEMIAGRRPFRGEYDDAVAYQVVSQQPERLTSIRAGVPVELESVVTRLLSKSPAERYQSTTDLLDDLKTLTSPVESGVPRVRPPSRYSRRRRVLMAGAGGVVLALLGLFTSLLGPGSHGQIRSLAVLPFVNLSSSADEGISDQMTDQLITELCKVHSVRVISRTSAMAFKGKQLPLTEIARALNVDGIITATCLLSGARVRINAQLTRADEENIWAESYDRNNTDILDLQSDIARTIAVKIQAELTPGEVNALLAKHQVSPQAYDLVARGNFMLSTTQSSEGADKASGMMRQALEIDSGYAEAHIGLALTLILPAFWSGTISAEHAAEVERAVAKAIEIDPMRGRPYTLRGQLYWLQGDFAKCMEAHKKAVELSPNDGYIRTTISVMMMLDGHYEEGVREAEKAVALDPLSHYVRCNLMTWYYAVHRYSDARAEAGRILEIDSTWLPAHDILYRLSFQEGNVEEALLHERRAIRLGSRGTMSMPENISWSQYKEWNLKLMEENARTDPSNAGGAALEYSMVGEKEKALYWLNKASERPTDGIFLMLFYPDFDCLRDDSRFEQIVSRVHLPVAAYCTPDRKKPR